MLKGKSVFEERIGRALLVLQHIYPSYHRSGNTLLPWSNDYSYNEDDLRLIKVVLEHEFPFEMQWFEIQLKEASLDRWYHSVYVRVLGRDVERLLEEVN